MNGVPSKPLPCMYEEWVASAIDADGFSLPYAMQRNGDDSLIVYALAVPPADAYKLMLARWSSEQPRELIFALDRFALEGQGTTLGDLLAGFYFTRASPRPFIIEYQHAPRIVKPINWSNPFWNAALEGELRASLRTSLGMA